MAFKTKSLAELKGRWEFSVRLEHGENPSSRITTFLPFLTCVMCYRCCSVGVQPDSQVRMNTTGLSGSHNWRVWGNAGQRIEGRIARCACKEGVFITWTLPVALTLVIHISLLCVTCTQLALPWSCLLLHHCPASSDTSLSDETVHQKTFIFVLCVCTCASQVVSLVPWPSRSVGAVSGWGGMGEQLIRSVSLMPCTVAARCTSQWAVSVALPWLHQSWWVSARSRFTLYF